MLLRDAKFIESIAFDKVEIATMFDIPPHMVGDLERATLSNIEQENLSFLQNAINPILVQFQEEYRERLIKEKENDYYVNINLAMYLREEKKTRDEYYKIMLNKA